MKLFAFLVALALFVGGLALFGYTFDFPEELRIWSFAGGIVAVSLAFVIPFHLLGRTDRA